MLLCHLAEGSLDPLFPVPDLQVSGGEDTWGPRVGIHLGSPLEEKDGSGSRLTAVWLGLLCTRPGDSLHGAYQRGHAPSPDKPQDWFARRLPCRAFLAGLEALRGQIPWDPGALRERGDEGQ